VTGLGLRLVRLTASAAALKKKFDRCGTALIIEFGPVNPEYAVTLITASDYRRLSDYRPISLTNSQI